MIGIVGAGTIVSAAHLPAYAKLGLPVAAIHDVDEQRGRDLAAQWNIRWASSIAAVLDDPAVEVVDIAVPPGAQVPIVEAALRAGKHVLAQKPLAPNLDTATRLVAMAAAEDRYLVVNQQMRWTPIVHAIRQAVADGSLGPLTWLSFDCDICMQPVAADNWLVREPRMIVLMNTIHLLDTSRYLLGEPESVLATLRQRDPQLNLSGETGVMIALEFAGQRQAWINDRLNAFGDHRAFFQAVGVNGVLRGQFGLWTNYPTGAADQIEYRRLPDGSDWQPVPVAGRWIPDAFTGPIGELVAALRDHGEPMTTGREHLRTLALVDAVYESARSGRRLHF